MEPNIPRRAHHHTFQHALPSQITEPTLSASALMSALQASSDGVLVVMKGGEIAQANASACRLFASSTLVGRGVVDVLFEQGYADPADRGAEVLLSELTKAGNGAPLVMCHVPGERPPLRCTAAPLDEVRGVDVGTLLIFSDASWGASPRNGDFLGIGPQAQPPCGDKREHLRTVRDVLEKRVRQGTLELEKTYAALKRSESRLACAQRAAKLGVWEWHPATGDLEWSDEMFNIVERSRDGYRPTAEAWLDFMHPDEPEARERNRLSNRLGQPQYEDEFRVVMKPSGRVKWLHMWGETVRDWQEAYLRGTVQDVTEQRAAEAQRVAERRMLEAQKLESLRVLAGGIAHDFNNLLMGVLGGAELALLVSHPEERAHCHLETIKGAALRLRELTNQILAYSGRAKLLMENLALNQFVESLVPFLSMLLPEQARVGCELSTAPTLVRADAAQLRQVLTNLVTNAAESLAGRPGTVTLRTGLLDADGALIRGHLLGDELAPGKFAFVEVADSGCGMDEQTLQRSFDPFFSTKAVGRGLGLATVLGTVRAHQGAIDVQSAPDGGTTIRVLLPALVAEAEREEHDAELRPSWVDGTVLVVDDEEIVRVVAGSILKSVGLRAALATGGREAVDFLQSNPGQVSVVLLDLSMPGMDGMTTLREIRRVEPHVKVVLSSGYDRGDAMQRFGVEGADGFVQKPYGIQELTSAIASVLAPTKGAS